MDAIWQSEGLDLRSVITSICPLEKAHNLRLINIVVYRMSAYGSLSMGKNIGMIEIVRNSKTVFEIQKKQDILAAMQLAVKELHRWIKEHNRDKL